MIKGYVNGQTLRFEQDVVVTETIDYLHAEFSFDESWDGCAIWAHFTKGLELYDVLLDDEREIKAERHLNLGTGDWKVYLHGNRTVGADIVQRITTEEQEIRVENTGVRNGSPLPEIEADVAEQLTALANEAKSLAEDAAEKADAIGDLDDLVTEEKDTLVGAVNEVAEEVGNLDVDAEKVGKTVTLTITMRDGTEKQVTVSDGVSIQSVTKTSSAGLVDTYTIAFDNGTSTTFTVTNGEDGEGAVSDEIKEALLGCFENTAWANANGRTYYNTLVKALDGGKTLASISAAYTGGEVEEGAPLSELTGVAVTAHYAGGTTHVLTGGYALSGSIAIGENTITVTYRDKTTTFTVTGIPYDSSPEILYEDKTWDTSGNAANLAGSCLTEFYEFTPDLEGVKATQYWDDENQYTSTTGVLYRIKYIAPNSAGVAFSSKGRTVTQTADGTLAKTDATARTTDEENKIFDTRYKAAICDAGNYPLKISFNLTTADAEDSYAYWTKSLYMNLLPVGVQDGDIIFAGENTPYYGLRNIHDLDINGLAEPE